MHRTYLLFALAFGTAFSSSPVTAEPDETAERLKACAAITEASARFECYEALGKETLVDEALAEEPSVAVAPAAGSAETAPAVAATGAAVATESVPAASSAPTNVPINGERPAEEFRVAVSSCQLRNAGDIYFMLDNGEVWKRTGGQKIRVSECVFSATLRKDFFGYKMFIDDDKGSVRVKRVK